MTQEKLATQHRPDVLKALDTPANAAIIEAWRERGIHNFLFSATICDTDGEYDEYGDFIIRSMTFGIHKTKVKFVTKGDSVVATWG